MAETNGISQEFTRSINHKELPDTNPDPTQRVLQQTKMHIREQQILNDLRGTPYKNRIKYCTIN